MILPADSALVLDRVTLRRGPQTALEDVSLALGTGSLAAILGPNGAGKTSFLRVVQGALAPDAGTVHTLGLDLSKLGWREASRLRRRIGLMPQSAAQAAATGLTVREVVEIGRVAFAPPGRPLGVSDHDVCEHWIQRFGLERLAERPFHQLSGGEQRKTHLARIFSQEPELILLDEPAGHLDLTSQDGLTRLIAEVWKETRATIVIVTHELRHLPPETTHIVLLSKGRVMHAGPPSEALTGERLSALYGEPLEVHNHHGHYVAVLAAREEDAHGRT